MFEIAVLTTMVGMGIVAIKKGKIKLSASRIVEGIWARLIGVILLVPLPLYIGIPIAFGPIGGGRGQQAADPRWQFTMIAVALFGAAVVIAAFIALLAAKPTNETAPTFADSSDEDLAR